MYTVTFDDGNILKIKTDEEEPKWNTKNHKFFNASLNPVIITLLCIQKYHFNKIDKNIFLKIIAEIVDISYLLDFNIFLNFILTNQKHNGSNTYEDFLPHLNHKIFNGISSRRVNSKCIVNSSITRGVKDIQEVVEEIIYHKTSGLVMILCNTIEIIYLDVTKNISCIDLSLNFDFFEDLDKKQILYDIIQNKSVVYKQKVPKILIIPVISIFFILVISYYFY